MEKNAVSLKEMSIEEIRSVSLDILNDIHQFCKKTDIHYSLGYGTLLGAIRHKGFIPWDDDIDIIMPRPDYNRFCAQYHSEQFEIISPLRNNCGLSFTRIADTKQTFVKAFTPWSTNNALGIWVDVFPIDGVPSDYESFMDYDQRFKKMYNIVCLKRMQLKYQQEGWNTCPVTTLLGFIKHFRIFLNDIYDLTKHYDIESQKIDFETASFVGGLATDMYTERFPHKILNNYILAPFEGQQYFIIADYHEYLTTIYGDYMKLPPVEKRVRHSQHSYFWKYSDESI